jgi:hypothetical protein
MNGTSSATPSRVDRGTGRSPANRRHPSTQSLVSLGILAFTLSPMSHAALYVGDGQVVEAVGAGVQQRRLADYLAGESTVAAFRHPDISAEQAQRLQTHARSL